jgi:hypothetical protein
MNLGKTITLPGFSEALDCGSGACANVGAAIPRVTVSNMPKPAPFITILMRELRGLPDPSADGLILGEI